MLDGKLLIKENHFMTTAGVLPSGVGRFKHHIWEGEQGNLTQVPGPGFQSMFPFDLKK
jgi:hypothetical protein